MGRSTRRAIAVTALIAGAAACGLFPDLGNLSGNDASGDVNSIDAPQIDGGSADAPVDAASDVQPGDGGCPSGRGPAMVKLDPKICIDTTEVTVAQYRVFVQDIDGGAFPQSPECAWNATMVPSNGVPGTGKNGYPIANVNWCQAQAFCAWAGKALCGSFDGGPYPYVSYSNSAQSVWMSACSANGTQSYPYGATFEAGACNLQTGDASAPVAPVGSFTKCEGSLPGVFDMVGNIKEWDNACSPSGTDAADDLCRRRGSGFDEGSNPVNQNCGWDEVDTRDHQSYTSGIRCCAYLP